MKPSPPRYRTFLVTIWEERHEQDDDAVWRYRLEDPRCGKSKFFHTPEALWAAMGNLFLEEQETIGSFRHDLSTNDE
jgi:hypothetical protein